MEAGWQILRKKAIRMFVQGRLHPVTMRKGDMAHSRAAKLRRRNPDDKWTRSGKWIVCTAERGSSCGVESSGVAKSAVLAAKSRLCDWDCATGGGKETRPGGIAQRVGDTRRENVVERARTWTMGSELRHDALDGVCRLRAAGRYRSVERPAGAVQARAETGW
jgi:hypothetical protein